MDFAHTKYKAKDLNARAVSFFLTLLSVCLLYVVRVNLGREKGRVEDRGKKNNLLQTKKGRKRVKRTNESHHNSKLSLSFCSLILSLCQ